ncbi:hypothetical protein [Mesorhizobium neociceri]|uniref:Uncharacterized protein n=1 Tax=Mesorhizobium neociceri TaxID=1307853 RepID=A0A838B1G4_9HYPH|nr:hypothetical protein [Mesorhizobium neociceri]MBA1139360.1 hypothetical protein [Mesorhizobium neociceri]
MAERFHENEIAYRGYMVMADIYQRGLTSMISEVIAFALMIYLISTYSRISAIALSACLIAYVTWKDNKQVNKMLETMAKMEELYPAAQKHPRS